VALGKIRSQMPSAHPSAKTGRSSKSPCGA
jgi:hypothetical protein